MNLVFMGTPDFAVPSLERLLDSQHKVAGVVTQPDRPKGRGRRLMPPPIKEVALAHRVPVLQPEKLKAPASLDTLRKWSPDLIAVVAFGILPPEVLEIPAQGTINVHPSLLPRYRGAAPMNWVIIQGESKTGVTTFLIVPKVDSGDIILQQAVPIDPDETAGELHDRLKVIGADLLLETLKQINDGTARPYTQCEDEVSLAPKLTKEDARIEWSKDAASIRNLIRGTNPWPGAFTTWEGEVLKVHRAKIAEEVPAARPGKIVKIDPTLGIQVATAQGVLWLTEVQQAGKRSMTSAEWVRGQRIEPGARLGV